MTNTIKTKNRRDAGNFLSWLNTIKQSLQNEENVTVPCGDCRGCCTSSYFIDIHRKEIDTLLKIPKKLLFQAPGLPKGNMVLGYHEDGHCPLFIDNNCSIYQYRPFTCRIYDCRAFAAAGIDAGNDEKVIINKQVKSWYFTYKNHNEELLHEAIKRAACFMIKNADCFPKKNIPTDPTHIALLAIISYEFFLNINDLALKTLSLDKKKNLADMIIEASEKMEKK